MTAPADKRAPVVVPRGVWVLGLLLAAAPFAMRWPWPAGATTVSIVSSLRLLIEAGALLLAARSVAQPAVRQVLLGLAAISMVSTLTIAATAGTSTWVGSPLDRIWYLLSYVLAAGLFLRWPRLPGGGHHVTLVIDTIITAGGLGVLMWVFTVAPYQHRNADSLWRWVTGGGEVEVVAQVAQVIGLNVLVLRGQVLPTRTAFWWFMSGQVAYVPLLLLVPLSTTGSVAAGLAHDLFYYAGTIPTLVAAVHIRAAAGAPPPEPPRRVAAALELNPVALLTPILLAAALAAALVRERTDQVLLLGFTLVVTTLLLVGRLVRSAWDNARLARERAEVRRQLEDAKLEAVGRLAGGVAHEFNNLMHSVLGYAELAAAGVERDHPIQADLTAIAGAGTRAAELTAKLLQFSGRQPDLRQELDVSARVRALVPRLGSLLPAGQALRLDLTPAARAYVDPHQLDQLLTQLVANAGEAVRGGGGVTLVVHATTAAVTPSMVEVLAPGPGPHVVLEVSDTGAGIDPEALRRIFEPFFSSRPLHAASGLGLAAVYGIVVAHGGGLGVTSTPGQGTRVTVRWPVAAPAAA